MAAARMIIWWDEGPGLGTSERRLPIYGANVLKPKKDRSDLLDGIQRAVAIRALGWRLCVEVGPASSFDNISQLEAPFDLSGQSPLPNANSPSNSLMARARF